MNLVIGIMCEAAFAILKETEEKDMNMFMIRQAEALDYIGLWFEDHGEKDMITRNLLPERNFCLWGEREVCTCGYYGIMAAFRRAQSLLDRSRLCRYVLMCLVKIFRDLHGLHTSSTFHISKI